jgi:hypothetical protein
MTTTYPIALGIAEPGGVWHVETLTLHWDTDDVPDRLALEREAIAAWTASNVRSEAVHVWLMEDDGWDEDDPASG